jgi:hypothetical protein
MIEVSSYFFNFFATLINLKELKIYIRFVSSKVQFFLEWTVKITGIKWVKLRKTTIYLDSLIFIFEFFNYLIELIPLLLFITKFYYFQRNSNFNVKWLTFQFDLHRSYQTSFIINLQQFVFQSINNRGQLSS